MLRTLSLIGAVLLSLTLTTGCGDDDDSTTGAGGTSGTATCCTGDGDCGNQRCLQGTCVAVPSGHCINDKDCSDGETCQGAIECPCGVYCFVEATAGTCR